MKLMSIFNFCENTKTTEKCLEFLRENGMIKNSMDCEQCHKRMLLHHTASTKDRQRWNCSTCKSTKSVRDASLFQVRFFLLLSLNCMIYGKKDCI